LYYKITKESKNNLKKLERKNSVKIGFIREIEQYILNIEDKEKEK
jgi:hypothetical protein